MEATFGPNDLLEELGKDGEEEEDDEEALPPPAIAPEAETEQVVAGRSFAVTVKSSDEPGEFRRDGEFLLRAVVAGLECLSQSVV